MCGICGTVGREDERELGLMTDAMAHRGPDGRGVVTFPGDPPAGLGHRRLAIIDPVGGVQPMCDLAAGLALTFNGEIYNFRELRAELEGLGYKFTRDSDTEVLLRGYEHWKEGVVEKLRGMFAFAIWDAAEEQLFLARDRFGEKPLFVHEVGDNLFFASEIKGLLAVPRMKREVNLPAVWDYLAYRYAPGPKTLFAGIRKILPGTCATWKRGRFTERRYWTAPDRQAWQAKPLGGDTEQAFLDRLDESVRMQMVSDVPFGAFLSGGLDSSTIVALMTRHNSKVKTFSVGFGERAYSELGYAGEVARHLGTDHTELEVSERDMIEHLPSLVAYRDVPVSEPSDIPIYMLAKEASRTVKMVLTGEGSDEILGGYPKHVFERFAQGYQWIPGLVRNNLIAPLTKSLPYNFRRAKTAITNLNIEDHHERYVRWFGALSRDERDELSVLRLNGTPRDNAPPFDAPTIAMLRAGTPALRRRRTCSTRWPTHASPELPWRTSLITVGPCDASASRMAS